MRWIFALLLLTGAAFAQSSKPPNIQKGPSTQASPNGQQPNAKPSAATVEPFIAQEAQKKTDLDSKKRPKERLDGWSLSDEIAAIASTVAFFQFLALMATVIVMKRSARRQLRAYVHPLLPRSPLLDSDPFEVVIEIRNYGQTPAYEVTHWTAVRYFDLPLSKPLEECDPPGTRTVIAPSASNRGGGRGHRGLSDKEKAAIRDGKGAIYVWGKISYVDAFRIDRETRFRLVLNKKATELGGLTWDQEGNTAT